MNRRYFRTSMENLTAELDDQLHNVDLEVNDVEPEWVDGDHDHDGCSYYDREKQSTDD